MATDKAEEKSRLRILARAAAIQLVWIAMVGAGWALMSYAAFIYFGNNTIFFAIMALGLVPAGILMIHGGHILSDRLQ